MPFKIYDSACRTCNESGVLFREKFSKQNNAFYKQPDCKKCEYAAHRRWVENNRERNRELVMNYYFRKNGPRKHRKSSEMTDELRKEYRRNKSRARASRAKHARVDWDKELTQLVMNEAIDLCRLRRNHTGIEWHIDHVIPLKSKIVCGLHVWNNLAVIPAVENLRKGNKFCPS
jgi:hypothetical protein